MYVYTYAYTHTLTYREHTYLNNLRRTSARMSPSSTIAASVCSLSLLDPVVRMCENTNSLHCT